MFLPTIHSDSWYWTGRAIYDLTIYLIMPVLGLSNSAANKNMMSKNLANGHTVFWLGRVDVFKGVSMKKRDSNV